jgi:hypothetical protein
MQHALSEMAVGRRCNSLQVSSGCSSRQVVDVSMHAGCSSSTSALRGDVQVAGTCMAQSKPTASPAPGITMPSAKQQWHQGVGNHVLVYCTPPQQPAIQSWPCCEQASTVVQLLMQHTSRKTWPWLQLQQHQASTNTQQQQQE